MYFYDTEFGLTIKRAHAFRKAISTYSGPVIRIRDTANNAEQDVGFDAEGFLDTFTVTGSAALVKMYDQTGNGHDLVQATSGRQPIVHLTASPRGKPVARMDGSDDFLADATASTSHSWMVAKPLVVYLGGQRSTRQSDGRVWNVPHVDNGDSSPWFRIGMEIQPDTFGNSSYQASVRSNSNDSTIRLIGATNLNGWMAHALIPELGEYRSAGWPAQPISLQTTVTYPNATRLFVGAGGASSSTSNNGADFMEIVVMDATGVNGATFQTALDKMAFDALYGPNMLYKFTANNMFGGSTTDCGFAEIELRDAIAGTDQTYPDMALNVNRQSGSGESCRFATDNNNSTIWGSGGGTGNPVMVFCLASPVLIQEVSIKGRPADTHLNPMKYTFSRFEETGWYDAAQVDNTGEGTASGQVYTDAVAWGDPISQTFGFDYKVEAAAITQTFGFDYEVETNKISQTFGFDYQVYAPVNVTFGFDYSVYLYKRFGFGYKVEADTGDVLGYRHIAPGELGDVKRVVATTITALGVGEAEIIDAGSVTTPDFFTLPEAVVVNHYNFYADYYNRIWVTPEEIRLSNPKIGFEYGFNVWNAYDRPNTLNTYVPTDVDGVSFVELGDLPMLFNPIEFKVLNFTIDADAPSQIDGNLFFDFTMGGDGFDLFALVLGVLKTLPNEPFKELWTWSTIMEVSLNGTEQRQALRDQPRTQAAYVVQILDEEDRRTAYQQFYSFATRSVIVPFFQYMTKLDADAALGDTRLYFDLSQSDIRADEYLVIFQPQTDEYSLVQVASLNVDGVNLVTPLTFDVDKDVFEVLPGRSMRLPNKSSLGMGAVNGQLVFKGESTSWRELLRPGSAVTLPSYAGYPVLPYKPIAVEDVDETFDSDVEVIDNESAPPVLRSTFTNPFVEQSKQWFVDREEEMDWWRTFFDYTKGMLRPFLVPTWRDDLPLVEEPVLGDNELVTSNTDYLDYWPNQTYRWIQIQSAAGVIYREVESVEADDAGVILSLDENIGLAAGSNEDLIVSFLNLTRLNEDEVALEHFVNHTIVTVKTRTVNQ